MRDQDQRQQETMGAGRTEGAAQEESGLLSAIVEGTPDAVFVKDLDGRYLLVNSACARILGRPKEEIVGRDDAQLLPPETAGRLAEVDRGLWSRGRRAATRRCCRWPGGPGPTSRPRASAATPRATPAGIIGISRDITERKEAERTQRFLAEAGALLSSLWTTGRPSRAWRRLAVPTLADWCGVDVLGRTAP
jgi:PAS domain S-box-containing protein